MADIFGGIEPPRWLQAAAERNAEHGQWGALAGTLAAGLFNSFKTDESAKPDPETGEKPKLGFSQGLFEARMNQADPMWKLKAAQSEARVASEIAQAETAHTLAQERIRESRAWMEDAPKISSWLGATREQRKTMPTPVAQSKTGMTAIQKTVLADENTDLREQISTIARDTATRTATYDSAIASAPPEIAASIASSPGGGYVTDARGWRIPSPAGLGILDAWRTSKGLGPLFEPTADVRTRLQKQKEEAAAAKPLSKEGKLISDWQKAKQEGAPEEVLKAYQTSIDKEVGGMPRIIDLGDGVKGVYLPGKGFHVLKNAERAARIQAALATFRSAVDELKQMEVAAQTKLGAQGEPISQETLNIFRKKRNDADRRFQQLLNEEQSTTPAAGGTTTAPADQSDPLGLFK